MVEWGNTICFSSTIQYILCGVFLQLFPCRDGEEHGEQMAETNNHTTITENESTIKMSHLYLLCTKVCWDFHIFWAQCIYPFCQWTTTHLYWWVFQRPWCFVIMSSSWPGISWDDDSRWQLLTESSRTWRKTHFAWDKGRICGLSGPLYITAKIRIYWNMCITHIIHNIYIYIHALHCKIYIYIYIYI